MMRFSKSEARSSKLELCWLESSSQLVGNMLWLLFFGKWGAREL